MAIEEIAVWNYTRRKWRKGARGERETSILKSKNGLLCPRASLPGLRD